MVYKTLNVLLVANLICLVLNQPQLDDLEGAVGPNAAALPKPECNYEVPVQCPINLKALGDKCLTNNECISPGICLNGSCQCPGQLLEFDSQCVRAPVLDENCVNEKCLLPYVCYRGKCDCPSNMKRENGKCKLECKENEIETLSGCVTVAKLGAPCESNVQCHTAFSYCFEGKCHCSAGTKLAGDSCLATFNCPDGQQPVKSAKGDLEKCVNYYCPSSSSNVIVQKIKLDSCPDKSYCVIPSYQDSEGFCCPDRPYCPVGEALVEKKCQNPDNANEVCPTDTHYCYAGLRAVYCCPLPCPSIPGKLTVVFQEKCYTKKDVGDNCQVTAQCRYNSECVNNTCQCPDGFVTQFVDNEMRCRKVCQPNEILAGADCLEIVAPGQECKVSAQCTGGTRCKDGKCQCPCNRPMYNSLCLSDPLCPNYGFGVVDPQLNKKGQLLECVPNSQKYGTCATGYFCNSVTSVYAGGVCCPLPDPVCDNSRRPAKDKDGKYSTCSDRYPNCPRGEYCKDYVKEKLPWMPSFSADGVCCARLFGDTEERTISSRDYFGYTDADCPTGHKLEKDQTGQTKFCNFQTYAGECGLSSACFKATPKDVSSVALPLKSGLCCRWSGK